MNVDDYADAAALLLEAGPPGLMGVGRMWRERAALHLAQRLDTELRGGVRRWSGDEQARALLKGAAKDLREAAAALFTAADACGKRGAGSQSDVPRRPHGRRCGPGPGSDVTK
jgi:hypothetical protein